MDLLKFDFLGNQPFKEGSENHRALQSLIAENQLLQSRFAPGGIAVVGNGNVVMNVEGASDESVIA